MNFFTDTAMLERVRRAADADTAERPPAVNAADVPFSLDAITLSWLDACLGSGVGEPRIVAMSTRDGSSGTSVRGSIVATREGADALHLFAKTYPSFEHRVANIVTNTAQAEGRFYMQIRPWLDIEAPQGFYWSVDEDRYRAIVIIEDVAWTKAARFCHAGTTIGRGEVESAVRLLARAHGPFLQDSACHEAFAWLPRFEDFALPLLDTESQHLIAIEEAREVLPVGLREAGQALFDAFSVLCTSESEGPRALLHSDVHLGNWYQLGNGTLGLCDWQCVALGHPMRDVSYAIATLIEPADRRLWERELIGIYLDELSRTTGLTFDFGVMFDAYRRWMLAALMMWTPTLVPPENMPAMQTREMSLLMIHRIGTAIDDLASLSI